MIINGNARTGARDLARHLSRADTNEHVTIMEVRGTAADDLLGCFREMEGVAAGTRCKKPLYHANIDPACDYVMTDAQWAHAINELEIELGLKDQPRAVVKHTKHGRTHVHVVWSRIDAAKMRAVPDSHNYRKHETVARRLEKDFLQKHVQGVHVDRQPDAPRPEAKMSTAEGQQAQRSGIDPRKVTAQVTALWRQTDSPNAFLAALISEGYLLARGDRRDFVLIDPAGEVHSLARRIDGVKTAELRQRLASVDPAKLPSASEAQKAIRRRARKAAVETAPKEKAPDMPKAKDARAPEVPSEMPKPAPTPSPGETVAEEPVGGQTFNEAIQAAALKSAVDSFAAAQSQIYRERLDKNMEEMERAAERKATRVLEEYDHAHKPKIDRDEAALRLKAEHRRREAQAERNSEPEKPKLLRRVAEFFVPKLKRSREKAEADQRAMLTAERHRVYSQELKDLARRYDSYAHARQQKEHEASAAWVVEKERLETRNAKDMADHRQREIAAGYRVLGTTEKAHSDKMKALGVAPANENVQPPDRSMRPGTTNDYAVLKLLAAENAKAFENQKAAYLKMLEENRRKQQAQRRTERETDRPGYGMPRHRM